MEGAAAEAAPTRLAADLPHPPPCTDGQIDRCEAEHVTAAPSNQPRPWYTSNAGHRRLQHTNIARNRKLRAGRLQRLEPQKTISGHMLEHDRGLMHERDPFASVP